jgi:GNAT superfamily N-acetyltransferase
MGGNYLGVRIMHPSQAAIDVVARGECGTKTTPGDPILDWVYNGCREDQQDHFKPLAEEPGNARKYWFNWLVDYTIRFGTNRDGCFGIVDKKTGKLCAAAICCPPRCIGFNRSGDEMGMNLREAGMAMGPTILVENFRMKSLGVWMANNEPSNLGNNFWYINIFATAPEYQGKGCGSALLRLMGEVADADGVPSYLETAGIKNTTFYSKKGGYEITTKSHIASFKGDGGGCGMLRPAFAKV